MRYASSSVPNTSLSVFVPMVTQSFSYRSVRVGFSSSYALWPLGGVGSVFGITFWCLSLSHRDRPGPLVSFARLHSAWDSSSRQVLEDYFIEIPPVPEKQKNHKRRRSLVLFCDPFPHACPRSFHACMFFCISPMFGWMNLIRTRSSGGKVAFQCQLLYK